MESRDGQDLMSFICERLKAKDEGLYPQDIIRELRQLTAEDLATFRFSFPSSPWISVEDRLPEEGITQWSGYVLVYSSARGIHKARYDYLNKCWRTAGGSLITPSDWQPLPNPPEK